MKRVVDKLAVVVYLLDRKMQVIGSTLRSMSSSVDDDAQAPLSPLLVVLGVWRATHSHATDQRPDGAARDGRGGRSLPKGK